MLKLFFHIGDSYKNEIIKSNYENRISEDILTSPLATGIQNGSISYFEILNDGNSYVYNFEVYDKDDNWLAIDVRSKTSLFDDSETIKQILLELKKYYSYLVLRIAKEFKDRI